MNPNERHVTLGLIIAIIVILLIMAFLWGYPYITSGRYYRTYERQVDYPVVQERSYNSSNGSSSTGTSYDYSSTSSQTTTTTTETEVAVP